MSHPSESTLALYAGKDLGLLARIRIALHVRSCEACGRRAGEFREIREWAHAQEGELPAGVNWDDLAGEMRANIRLGLSAGRCVAEPELKPEPKHSRWHWPAPAFVLPVLLLVVAGWIVESLHPPIMAPSQEIVVQAGASGIGVERNGRGFSLLQPQARNVVFTVRGEAAGARYVDEETGQVTISHVYAQ